MVRRLIIICLALLLPLNGWATTRLVEACPMQMQASHDHAAVKSSCCIEQQQFGDKSGQSCKAGQDCQTSTLYFASSSIAAIDYLSAAQPVVPLASQIAGAISSGVWRPPRP